MASKQKDGHLIDGGESRILAVSSPPSDNDEN